MKLHPRFVLVSFAVLVPLFLTTSGSSSASPEEARAWKGSARDSAANGRIVFVRDSAAALADFATDNIYSINPNGTGLIQLTSGEESDSDPLPSPNGKLIAFSSQRTYDPEDTFKADIWLVRADGSGLKRLTTRGAYAAPKSWSPDSKRITYRVGVDKVSTWTINANGTGNRFVARGSPLGVSPDGTKVIRSGFAADFRVADKKTGKLLTKKIVGDGSDSVWSPDSNRLLFVRANSGTKFATPEIWVVNANGTGAKRLTKNNRSDINPSWAPDGSLIAFSSDRGAGCCYNHIFVMRPDGRGVKQVTRGSWNDYATAWSARP